MAEELFVSLYGELTVADVAALQAIPASDLDDGELRIVDLVASTDPLFNLRRVPYQFVVTSGATEDLPPYLYRSTAVGSSGHWEMMIEPFHEKNVITGNGAPTTAPPLPNMRWIVNVNTGGNDPSRRLIWRSKDPFPAAPVVGDWVPDTEPIPITAAPTDQFNADWAGQLVQDTTTSRIYKAVNQTGLWALESDIFLQGSDILGSFNLTATQNRLTRELTANSVITLEDNIGKDIETRIIKGASTLSITTSGVTSLNGATGTIPITENIITLFNHGNNYYYY